MAWDGLIWLDETMAWIKSAPPRALKPNPLPNPAFRSLYLEEETELETPEQTAAEELQGMIDELKNTANLSRAADEQLDACVMASLALSMDELAKIEDLPESDPERFAEIQADIARAMTTQPVAFLALLQGMADSAVKKTADASQVITPASESPPLIDVSSSDLSAFVALRRLHQTEEARTGVRTYKTSGTYTNPKTKEVKPLSDRQILARSMQAINGQDQHRGSSTGLKRTTCWTEGSAKTGNAANAELAAGGRAKEAIKRRRAIFSKLKCTSIVAESGIGANDSNIMEDSCHGFAMIGAEIALVRVMTMYSKNGGKAGFHSWVPKCETIGALSFVVAQVYEHEYRRHFKTIHSADAALGTIRFAHLPAGSFLVLLPKDEPVKVFHNHVEIGVRAYSLFNDLADEKKLLASAVASLNTVRRKGKVDIHILELPEDDDSEE